MNPARSERRLRTACVAAFLASPWLAGCSDRGPASGPGVLTATVDSPNGAEGAALLKLVGDGIGQLAPLEGRVFSEVHGDTVLVVVVNDAGGALRFTIDVVDTTRKPAAALVEVSGLDDRLRDLRGYSVDIRR